MSNDSAKPAAKLTLSSKARRTKEQPITALVAAALGDPNLINLAAGLVDPLTLPVEETAAITQKILTDTARGRCALQYDTTNGLADLRRAALGHIEAMEGKSGASMNITADDFVITTGSQQALYLIGDAMVDPGDIVIAANPSYFVYTGTLSSLGAKVMTVPIDDDGMDVDAVEKLLEEIDRDGKLDRVRFIYCTSYFDNPTGLTLSLPRRKKLLELAKKFSKHNRILILEDAAYRELRYDGPALPSIKSFDPDNRFTILASTFSKPYAPGVKTGYTAMPADLLDAVLQQKGNHDFGSANLSQHIALEAMRSGKYAEQVKKLCAAYRKKRDTIVAALQRFMPKMDDLHWTHPHGGLYVWVTLPEAIDTSRRGMFNKAVDRGVLYVPGDYCFQPDRAGHVPTNHLRLSFGQVDPSKIEPGIERLAEVVKEQLGRGAGLQPRAAGSA